MVSRQPRPVLYLALVSFLFLLSCSPETPPPTQTLLYVYRFDPPALVEFSADLQPAEEIPFSIPRSCSLFDIFPAPLGTFLAIELSCPNGQTVLLVDTESGSMHQPVTDSDSHFLAWSGDGSYTYLKVDSLGDARILRASTRGTREDLHLTGWTYNLAAKPASDEFIFTLSRGLGYGSELHLARGSGRNSEVLYEDPFHYLSFARYSPEGSRIAFIKIPDSPVPFTVGELWVMDSNGSNPHKLADADAGHGYAANWSPDGEWIAFVKRENPGDESANQSSESLISNIYRVNVQSGEMNQVTFLTNGHAETPHISPDGNTLAFNTILDGRMGVQIADTASGEIRSLITESICCPAWMRK